MVSLVWVLVVSVVVGVCEGQDRPVVEVDEGKVMGLNTTEYNITYLEFLSIPYARPPTGARRFKDPEPADPWEGELDTSELPPPCNQLAVMGRENCLFVNVYTPEYALTIDYPLPVMVYIHGGGFVVGSANSFHGYQELVNKGVIVAMMQYRVGVLGFLSTEDAEAPGNLGLKDQTLALTWIKNNIGAFGGDPEKITIFGGSAGSASVHYQMLAPSAAGLFRGAILESGSSLCPWARGRNFLWAAQRVAESFECPTEPSVELVSCLQTVGAHKLDAAYYSLIVWNAQPFFFGPRVDGEYLPDEPVTLLQEGRYHHVPTIMGINRDEMALESVEMYAVPSIIDKLVGNFSVTGPASLELYPDEDPLNTANTVYNHYLGGINLEKENADNVTQMFSDDLFLMPHDWTVGLMSGHVPVFSYELHHRGQYGFADTFLNQGLDLPQAHNYISHSDDKQYQFYPKYANLTTPDDVTVGHLFTTMWTNFAKEQNPTPDMSLGFEWHLSDPSSLQHLKILPEPYMEDDQRADTRAFWESLPLRINNLLKP